MTKEQLQAKLAEYKGEQTKLIATLNAFNGAIQNTEYWLAELEKQNETTKTNEPS